MSSNGPRTRWACFDLGGTSLRSALVEARGAELTCVAERRRPAPGVAQLATSGPSATLAELRDALVDALDAELRGLLEGLGDGAAPAGIGLAFPGPVGESGEVLRAPTLWGDRDPAGSGLRAALERRWPGIPLEIVNDVTAAGSRFAPATGQLCAVVVGSGIGHKLFVDGRPLLGDRARGGELGHWRAEPESDGARCECGGRGHLGALSSGRSAPLQVRRALAAGSDGAALDPDSPELNARLAAAFRDGEPFAGRVVEAMARPLGQALAALHLGTGVEEFVILGGWARALGSGFVELLGRELGEACWTPTEVLERRVRGGPDDDDSGLLGMARVLQRGAARSRPGSVAFPDPRSAT